MKLIRKLGTRLHKNGYLQSWAEFLCPFCLQIVQRLLCNGLEAKSCGCMKKELNSKSNIKHGGKGTKLYEVWHSMKQRILNQNSKKYKDYGGRGITICPEWANDYIIFRDWSLSHGYKEGLQINRINNNGNYEPSNCNFVTSQENSQNRRTTKFNKDLITEIRENFKIDNYTIDNYTIEILAQKYKTTEKNISRIVRYKRWNNI